MVTNLFKDGFTKSSTVATIGMFGQNDFYFFYLQFVPTTRIINAGDTIRLWFQVGNTSSAWQGVTLSNSVALTAATSYLMSGLSASNTDYSS